MDEIKPIKLSKDQQMICNYNYIKADYQQGLNYGVSRETYVDAMEHLGAIPRDGKINAEIFVNDIFNASQNRK